MNKKCRKCGVTICYKNIAPNGLLDCKQCARGSTKCRIKYLNINLDSLSLENRDKISYRLKKKKFPSRYYQYQLKYKEKTRDLCGDDYIKTLLSKQLEVPFKEISPDLIELKRKQIKLLRDVKKNNN
jgi:hypothetical protein